MDCSSCKTNASCPRGASTPPTMVMIAIVLQSSFEFGFLLPSREVECFGLPDERTETCHPVATFFVQDGDIEEKTTNRSVSEPLQFRCMYLKQKWLAIFP